MIRFARILGQQKKSKVILGGETRLLFSIFIMIFGASLGEFPIVYILDSYESFLQRWSSIGWGPGTHPGLKL